MLSWHHSTGNFNLTILLCETSGSCEFNIRFAGYSNDVFNEL